MKFKTVIGVGNSKGWLLSNRGIVDCCLYIIHNKNNQLTGYSNINRCESSLKAISPRCKYLYILSKPNRKDK